MNGRLRARALRRAGPPRGRHRRPSLAEALAPARPSRSSPHLGRLARPEAHALRRPRTRRSSRTARSSSSPPAPSWSARSRSSSLHRRARPPPRRPPAHARRRRARARAPRSRRRFVGAGRRRLPHERRHRDRPRRGRGRSSTCGSRHEGASAFHVGRRSTRSRPRRRGSSRTRSRSARGSRASEIARPARRRGGARRRERPLHGRRRAAASTTSRWSSTRCPRCTSREPYKGVLDGNARGVFAGRIRRACPARRRPSPTR